MRLDGVPRGWNGMVRSAEWCLKKIISRDNSQKGGEKGCQDCLLIFMLDIVGQL